LESGVDQLAPDERKLLYARAEEVYALGARDLGVEPELARHLAEHDQLLGRDLAARHTGHDGIGAVLLQVGQKVVVGVLERSVLPLEDVLVPAGRQYGRDS